MVMEMPRRMVIRKSKSLSGRRSSWIVGHMRLRWSGKMTLANSVQEDQVMRLMADTVFQQRQQDNKVEGEKITPETSP